LSFSDHATVQMCRW